MKVIKVDVLKIKVVEGKMTSDEPFKVFWIAGL